MPSKLSGSFLDVFKTMGHSKEDMERFVSILPYGENKRTIEVDLPRTTFVDGMGGTHADFIKECQTEALYNGHYRQGNFDGGTAVDRYMFHTQAHILRLHDESDKPRGQEKYNEISEQISNYQNDWLNADNKKSLRFAYRDDSGILCGFGLAFNKGSPKNWLLDISRNTTAPIDQRVSTLFGEGELAVKNAPKIELSSLPTEIELALNSQFVNQMVSGLIGVNGKVSYEKYEALEKQLAGKTLDKVEQLKIISVYAKKLLPNNDQLKTILDDANRRSITDDHFYEDDNFKKEIEQINALVLPDSVTYVTKSNEFEKELEQYKDSEDQNKLKLWSQGQKVLGDIKDVERNEGVSSLPKLNKMLECCITALKDPTAHQNMDKLVNLADKASKKESKFWQKLGASLLMFAGAVVMLAGFAAAAVVSPLGLVGVGAGALMLNKGQTFWQKTKEKTGLHKSASDFKEALGQVKSDPNAAPGRPDSPADSGIEEGNTPPTTTPTPK